MPMREVLLRELLQLLLLQIPELFPRELMLLPRELLREQLLPLALLQELSRVLPQEMLL